VPPEKRRHTEEEETPAREPHPIEDPDELIDESIDESFPASDPPSFTPSRPGPPSKKP